MSSTPAVAIILGSGSPVGYHVSKELASRGYHVVLVSRTSKETNENDNVSTMAADVSQPESIVGVFDKVKTSFGFPSVVVYNASSSLDKSATDPLDIELDDFQSQMSINTASVFVAAREAVKAFAQLPSSASRTFVFTGNCLNVSGPLRRLLVAGMGKSATAHLIQGAALAYADRGFKRLAGVWALDGEAHGTFYADLTGHKEQGPPLQTFVKGEGYKKFDEKSIAGF